MQKACRDLPTSFASAQPPSAHSKASNNLLKQPDQQDQFNRPSNRSHQDQRINPSNSFQPSPAKGVPCPNSCSCQYSYKCSHFQDLYPLERREHVKKIKTLFQVFGYSPCTTMHIKKKLSLCRLRKKEPHNAPWDLHCKKSRKKIVFNSLMVSMAWHRSNCFLNSSTV